MTDMGIIIGSGIYELPVDQEPRTVENRFGEAELAIFRVGRWTVGGISRHGKVYHHLPHTIPHQANLMALKLLGTRAVLATTSVGMADPGIPLGQPILFDALFPPENRLPNGEPYTISTRPGDPQRGHFVGSEPFSPSLRRQLHLPPELLESRLRSAAFTGTPTARGSRRRWRSRP